MTIKKSDTVSTPVAEDPVAKMKGTEAVAIWEEIKDLPISMFGLPDQTVEHHCTFVPIEPSKLYLTTRSSSALPALETTLKEHGDRATTQVKKTGAINKSQFTIELVDKFIIVARLAPNPLTIKK